jgi:hypothetical protein
MNSIVFDSAIGGAIVGVVVVVVVFVGIVVFVYATKKNIRIGEGKKMGVNLASDLKCPSCGAAFPIVRIPKNYRQFLWGGWTCNQCGEEFDKWLAPVPKSK